MVVNPFVQGFLSELEKDAGLKKKTVEIPPAPKVPNFKEYDDATDAIGDIRKNLDASKAELREYMKSKQKK